MTVMALQAASLYVEKTSTNTIGKASRSTQKKYGKIVQVGTMNRSRPAVRQAMQFIKDGGIGKVYMARGLCFKPRPSIGKYPDGPLAAGATYKLNVEGRPEPAWDAAYLSKVDYDLWLGPAAKTPFNVNHFHYNWHWHGLADATGQTGPAPVRHRRRWCLEMMSTPSGAPWRTSSCYRRTANVRLVVRSTGTARCSVRHTPAKPPNEGAASRLGNLFYGSGLAVVDGRRRQVAVVKGPSQESRAPVPRPADRAAANPLVRFSTRRRIPELATPSRQRVRITTFDIIEGNLSSALPPLPNLYRCGPSCISRQDRDVRKDRDADKLLTREYRKGSR